ncbi:MAG: hypothetical protein MUE39_05805 [Gammaproteobacteria bacterium]|jgi:hypothetical protein|nr:hypothetical protein [Gammaproteobacteria bacterium]
METLAFTAVTSSGRAYDIAFPLHPQTRSAQGVSDLLTAVLEAVSRTAEGRNDVSDGDVFQALAMALAVRARMVGGSAEHLESLVTGLFADAHAAARQAQPYAAGRA